MKMSLIEETDSEPVDSVFFFIFQSKQKPVCLLMLSTMLIPKCLIKVYGLRSVIYL